MMMSIGLSVLIIGTVLSFAVGVFFNDAIWKIINRVLGKTP